jgi:hypothetical protein
MAAITRSLCLLAIVFALPACGDDGIPGAQPWWGEPIVAEPDEWTWVDFPDTVCADGSPTGLAVNLSPSPNPSGVLVFLEGGGACWNYANCSLSTGQVGLALHMDGYGRDEFEGTWGSAYTAMVPMDREDEANPFRDAHYVFLPYCTADVFAGDRTVELYSEDEATVKTVHFRGRRNMEEYLERLVPTFHDTPRVWLAGTSAGGFGAQLNWFLFAERWNGVRVDVIADSGQPINPPQETWEAWLEAWNLTMPPGCTDCEEGVDRILRYGAETLLADGARYALVAYRSDPIIAAFFGISVSEHEAAIDGLIEMVEDPSMPNREQARYFVIDGLFHTTFLTAFTTSEVDGVLLSDWIGQMVTDDPAWESVGPN